MIKHEVPILGKWYKVIGEYKNGFIGECVSYSIDNELPVILEDTEFNGGAFKVNEIEECLKQPIGKYIHPNNLQ